MHTPNPVLTQAHTAYACPSLIKKKKNHGSGRAVVVASSTSALVSGQVPCISRDKKHALSDRCCGPLTSGPSMAVTMVLSSCDHPRKTGSSPGGEGGEGP